MTSTDEKGRVKVTDHYGPEYSFEAWSESFEMTFNFLSNLQLNANKLLTLVWKSDSMVELAEELAQKQKQNDKRAKNRKG